jgi:hypothetical protein
MLEDASVVELEEVAPFRVRAHAGRVRIVSRSKVLIER